MEACEARICRVMEVCGLGGEGKKNSPGEADAHPATEAAGQQNHSFWHSGLNTAVRPGSEPATEGNGEKIAGAVGTKLPINQKNEQNGARSHGSDQPVHMYCCADSHGTSRSSVHCFADTPSVLQRLFMGRTKGLKGDGAGMDIRVFPPKARDSRFERSMGDALRQQNEKLEMQEVFDSSCIIDDTSGSEV